VEDLGTAGLVDEAGFDHGLTLGRETFGDRGERSGRDAAPLLALVDEELPQPGRAPAAVGEHDEAGELAVGFDRPVPRDDRLSVDDRWVCGVGDRLADRSYESPLAVCDLERADRVDVPGVDGDESDRARWSGRAGLPATPVRLEQLEARVVGPLAP